jgi:hypothetical protein
VVGSSTGPADRGGSWVVLLTSNLRFARQRDGVGPVHLLLSDGPPRSLRTPTSAVPVGQRSQAASVSLNAASRRTLRLSERHLTCCRKISRPQPAERADSVSDESVEAGVVPGSLESEQFEATSEVRSGAVPAMRAPDRSLNEQFMDRYDTKSGTITPWMPDSS